MPLDLKIADYDGAVELYRTSAPPHRVQNLIGFLKIYTNGILRTDLYADLDNLLVKLRSIIGHSEAAALVMLKDLADCKEKYA